MVIIMMIISMGLNTIYTHSVDEQRYNLIHSLSLAEQTVCKYTHTHTHTHRCKCISYMLY